MIVNESRCHECTLNIDVIDDKLGQANINILRDAKGLRQLKINNIPVVSQSQVSSWLPISIIEPTTFDLISGSPSEKKVFGLGCSTWNKTSLKNGKHLKGIKSKKYIIEV